MKRNIEIDIVKGIAIVLMVMAHAMTDNDFIYLFHMAVFFIATGYFYKDSAAESIDTVKNYVIKKLKALWFPYALWTGIFSLLHNVFIEINIYTNNPLIYQLVREDVAVLTEHWTWQQILMNIIKGCILPGNVQMGGALWFLATLLQISVGYCVIDFVLRKVLDKKYILYAQFAVAMILLCIGYWLSVNDVFIYGLDCFFSCYILYFIGVLLGRKGAHLAEIRPMWSLVVVVATLLVLCVLNTMGDISLRGNDYVNPIFMLTASLAGWFLLYELALLIKRNTLLKNVFTYIGANTLPIVVLHFLAFKVVTLIGIVIYGDSLLCLAAFPFLYTGFGWCALYTIAGTCIPLGLNVVWLKIKKKIRG